MIVNNKTLQINEKEIELEYTIRKHIEYDNHIVILMYDDAVISNNVLCFDKQGMELWRINDILNIKKPTGNTDYLINRDTRMIREDMADYEITKADDELISIKCFMKNIKKDFRMSIPATIWKRMP